MTVTLTDPLLGQLVDGRYEVLSRIARGGMATVYLAMDRKLERQVAMKVMHPHLAEGAAGADFVARFRREAKAAARLTHPGLVSVFDQGADSGMSYLTMEYVAGTNLRKVLLEDGPLPLGEALRALESVLEALAVAHAAGLIHRDIKPENVLVGTDGTIKVADFGLARAMAEATSTSTGTVLGTVAYLAPEQVVHGEADARTDLYAVGILLYELLTGQQPFTGPTPLQIAYQHVNADVPQPSAVVEWLPPQVDRLVAILTAREPSERPADAAAALNLVHHTLSELDPQLLARRATAVPAGTQLDLLGSGGLGAPSNIDHSGNPMTRSEIRRLNNQLDTDPAAERERRKRPPLLIPAIAAAAALVVGLGLTTWWYFASGPGAYTTVPEDLLGLTTDDATASLADQGLGVTTVTEVFHPSEPAGEVLAVDPPVGDRIGKGGAVQLTVSKGPDLREVPGDMTGKPGTWVAAVLAGVGFDVPAPTSEYSDTVPAGKVLAITDSQGNPIEPGAELPVDTTILLACSAGPAPVTIPDVVGMAKDAAIAALSDAGLKVSVSEAYHPTVAAGIVKAQSPAAGATGHRMDTVAITVSKGPQPKPEPPEGTIMVPYLFNKPKEEAWSILDERGFDRSHEGSCVAYDDNCVVYDQNPKGGTYVPKGTLVTIYIKNK